MQELPLQKMAADAVRSELYMKRPRKIVVDRLGVSMVAFILREEVPPALVPQNMGCTSNCVLRWNR